MACCKCCCGNEDCSEGQEGKCCCGGASGDCCQEGQYCCDGVCEDEPCQGCCCVYAYDSGLDEWSIVSQVTGTAEDCDGAGGDYHIFKPGVTCEDDLNPCEGDPAGTCCDGNGGCATNGPGTNSDCYPTGHPNDQGCYCDDLCYTVCFDCCGADASNCCLATPTLSSLWDDSAGPGLQKLPLALLSEGLAAYSVDSDEAWGAAMQSGSGKDGLYYTHGWARMSLLLCLQAIADGEVPWVAIRAHRSRVEEAGTQLRLAAL